MNELMVTMDGELPNDLKAKYDAYFLLNQKYSEVWEEAKKPHAWPLCFQLETATIMLRRAAWHILPLDEPYLMLMGGGR
jgi:hypothetical protein